MFHKDDNQQWQKNLIAEIASTAYYTMDLCEVLNHLVGGFHLQISQQSFLLLFLFMMHSATSS